jgi:hypothetical protein
MGLLFVPGSFARASAADAERAPARQRWVTVTTIAVVMFVRGHPLFFA